MSTRIPDSSLLDPELMFSVTRSGGPGGQNVNKVNSKVILKFNVAQSQILTDEEKTHLLAKLSKNLTKEGEVVISAQSSRSQLENRQLTKDKLDVILRSAFFRKKARKKTKPSRSTKEKRLNRKKRNSEKKKWRSSLD